MTTSKVRRAIAAVLCLACVALILVGAVNLPKKNAQAGQTILNDLRTRALLNVTGEGVVESYVNIAKKQAQEKAKAENAGMAGIREAVAKAEEDTRAKYANAEFTSGVKYRTDDFECRYTHFRVFSDRDTSSVVFNGNDISPADSNSYIFAVSGKGFVNRVIHYLVDKVIKSLYRS